MTKNRTQIHMLDKPYIRKVLLELQNHGYQEREAIAVLLKYYRSMRRMLGFEPNAPDFAKEIIDLERAVHRTFDPTDPNQIYIGHLRSRIKTSRRNKS